MVVRSLNDGGCPDPFFCNKEDSQPDPFLEAGVKWFDRDMCRRLGDLILTDPYFIFTTNEEVYDLWNDMYGTLADGQRGIHFASYVWESYATMIYHDLVTYRLIKQPDPTEQVPHPARHYYVGTDPRHRLGFWALNQAFQYMATVACEETDETFYKEFQLAAKSGTGLRISTSSVSPGFGGKGLAAEMVPPKVLWEDYQADRARNVEAVFTRRGWPLVPNPGNWQGGGPSEVVKPLILVEGHLSRQQ